MAQWKQDPQSRENIEEVTKELELPIFKPNALGKFRPWLKEAWNKIEDYLLNLKEIANSKEPAIIKKTGFNLDKTDSPENDSNKLFTAKGAKDLDDKKFDKTGGRLDGHLIMGADKKIISSYNYGYSLADSQGSSKYLAYIGSNGVINIGYAGDNTPINFNVVPTIKSNKIWTSDNFTPELKLDKSEAWKNSYKLIGNESTVTDLNDITEPGEYANPANAYKFTNSPVTNTAFTLSVLTINQEVQNYRTQILMTHNTEEIYKRVKINTSWTEWWRVDGGNRLLKTIEGDLEGFKRGTNGIFLTSGNALNFSSKNSKYHFNYDTFPNSSQITTFYLSNGDSASGLADLNVQNLFAKGSILANGNITAFSDLRLKTDINKIKSALDKIEKINGYTFKMNGKERTGLIAQEVKEILPQAVIETETEEKYLALDYGSIAGLLVEAIKEINKELNALKKKVGD